MGLMQDRVVSTDRPLSAEAARVIRARRRAEIAAIERTRRYRVMLCRHCVHPAGQHLGDVCRLCGCPHYEDGCVGEWSHAETDRLLADADKRE